jgi:hypothetical protein
MGLSHEVLSRPLCSLAILSFRARITTIFDARFAMRPKPMLRAISVA